MCILLFHARCVGTWMLKSPPLTHSQLNRLHRKGFKHFLQYWIKHAMYPFLFFLADHNLMCCVIPGITSSTYDATPRFPMPVDPTPRFPMPVQPPSSDDASTGADVW